MQIACPQCSMRYDLDPRLLPPTGASVQCTRCSFVFTALPSGEVLVPGLAQGPQGGPAVPRSAVGTTTQVFGSPYAASTKPGAPNIQTTQVFGALPAIHPDRTPAYGTGTLPTGGPEASQTPAFGSATPGAPGPSLPAGAPTQVFVAGSGPAKAPSPTTTQVFGSAAVAAKALSPTTTQVFGSAAVAAKAPSPATTQVFGASSIPPQAPSPATTQVFGSAAVAAKAPSPATTQVFGSAEVQAVRQAKESAAPPPAPASGPAPWLAEPAGPAPAPQASSLELPEEPVSLPAPSLPSLPPEPAVARSSSLRSAPLELPPEILAPSPPPRQKAAAEPASGGGRERVLFALVGVVALGLTAWLSYPVWRSQGSEMPAEALSLKDQAASLLRRDDVASREQAIAVLRELVSRYPKFTEAQAELVVALSLQLDDVKAELEWISQEEQRLQKEISALEMARSPADWQGRINARMEDVAALRGQKRPLDTAAADLAKQLEQPLAFIRAAPEAEPSADVVARWKALAVYEGVQGNAQAIALAERLAKVESPPLWSVVTRVEFGLNAPSPVNALPELSEALAQVRARDKAFFRAFLLGARLALRQNQPEAAQSLLETVVALNRNHTLAQKLQKRAAAASSP